MRRAEEAGAHEVPLTTGVVLRWSGLLLAVVSTLVSVIWYASSLKADIGTLRLQLEVSQRQFAERRDDVDKRLNKLEARQENTDKALGELEKKLDVAVTLLQRIDQKVGRP